MVCVTSQNNWVLIISVCNGCIGEKICSQFHKPPPECLYEYPKATPFKTRNQLRIHFTNIIQDFSSNWSSTCLGNPLMNVEKKRQISPWYAYWPMRSDDLSNNWCHVDFKRKRWAQHTVLSHHAVHSKLFSLYPEWITMCPVHGESGADFYCKWKNS